MKLKFLNILTLQFFIALFFLFPAYAFDLNNSVFSVDLNSKDINNIANVQKIESILNNFEKDWNNHDLEKLSSYYNDTFVNGDGLDLEGVKNLTKELWDSYPNIKTTSKERVIRINGDFATVSSTDIYEGNSKNQRSDVGSNGILRAVSIGDIFLKRYGRTWKITSDRTIFERVSIGYGKGVELIEQDKVIFTAPEQIASGQTYTATINFDLPEDIKPITSVSKEVLSYPQVTLEDKYRLVDGNLLERLFTANKLCKNELVSATIGLTGGVAQPKLLGLIFLTRRVNVVPISNLVVESEVIKDKASSALNNPTELLNSGYYEGFIENEYEKSREDSLK